MTSKSETNLLWALFQEKGATQEAFEDIVFNLLTLAQSNEQKMLCLAHLASQEIAGWRDLARGKTSGKLVKLPTEEQR